MRTAFLLLVLLAGSRAESDRYELHGRLTPATRAAVWLNGAVSPFEDSTMAGDDGRFRFRDLPAGTYTLGVFVPGRGEVRRTIEVGPSQADSKRRIGLDMELRNADFQAPDSGALVSTRELAIPDEARRAYGEAQKKLNKHDVDGAVRSLEHAVEVAPRFAEAWNHLGTIAYQTADYPRAEGCFRKSLAADQKLYQPLVNLGGVLLNLKKFGEALQYNRYAVLERPNDALANSQLGMNYFYLNRLDLGEKYLTAAKQIDPAHFSHPQLMLAEIYRRRQERERAAAELDEFLRYHPDAPEALNLKENIAWLRGGQGGTDTGIAAAFKATGMGRSFSETPALPQPPPAQMRVDAVIGSGRHARVLLTRGADGVWQQSPMAWYADGGGRYAASPGPAGPVGADCLGCHTGQTGAHPGAIGCRNCHSAGARPAQAKCLECHVQKPAYIPGHGAAAATEDRFELNSAAYRLFESRCFQKSGEKLGCATCHPAHGFAKTAAGYREVCRSCHPDMHNRAALDCTRCHMPQRRAQDAAEILLTDHRIQRPM